MIPRKFIRLSVGALGLKVRPPVLPTSSPSSSFFACSSFTSCYCEIKLTGYPSQTAPVPLVPVKRNDPSCRGGPVVAATFYLDESALKRFSSTPCLLRNRPCRLLQLQVKVFTGTGATTTVSCAGGRVTSNSGKLLGKFSLPITSECCDSDKPLLLHSGWVNFNHHFESQLHVNVEMELDPRYIFQFDGEPELSPQIVQIQGSLRQPIFSCKFTRDRASRSSSGGRLNGAMGDLYRNRQSQKGSSKERKGWLIVIHDLSGSPVAAASMTTPFVATAGCDRVTRANPGAWLILRPGISSSCCWKPWARLEAWRERGTKGGQLGCRLQILADTTRSITSAASSASLVLQAFISTYKGGHFLIDTANLRPENPGSASATTRSSPAQSPRNSGDLCNFSIGVPVHGRFVMSASVQAEGKCSKPQVQIARRHISCLEDAAVFMALAAAVDLSMDACLPFTRKLGKSFSEPSSVF